MASRAQKYIKSRNTRRKRSRPHVFRKASAFNGDIMASIAARVKNLRRGRQINSPEITRVNGLPARGPFAAPTRWHARGRRKNSITRAVADKYLRVARAREVIARIRQITRVRNSWWHNYWARRLREDAREKRLLRRGFSGEAMLFKMIEGELHD